MRGLSYGYQITCCCCRKYFETDPDAGIVRMEFLGGELLYAMRVVSHGAFNLCPSEVCNPEGGDGASHCILPEIAAKAPLRPVEFLPYFDVPAEAVAAGKRIVSAGGLDVGGIEYLEATDGRYVFYDINAIRISGDRSARHLGSIRLPASHFLRQRLARNPSTS